MLFFIGKCYLYLLNHAIEMIKTRNLTKRFGDFTAVDDLNVSIDKGELFSLLGLNGAGKTTTIKMLSCLIRPSGGSARVMVKDLVKEARDIKQKINVSPQETAVAPNLTVRENLRMIAGVYGLTKDRIRFRVNEMIDVFSLQEVRDKKQNFFQAVYNVV